ncbi:MAG TPA: glycosyltransferase family 4 protein [Nitrososphaerales archaeon]|nr:glycosyltransferase family 4 protein [Nitrososphaerales archaeon]
MMIQSFGRFGGAERAALLHYNRLKAAGKDVDLFADFTDKHLWARQEIRRIKFFSLPRGLCEPESLKLMHVLDGYDRILVHHHVEPLLAFRITKQLSKKTAWYSGSIFEPAYSELLHGEDYRKVSVTFEATSKSFYGKYLGGLGLALFPISKRMLHVIDYETVARYRKIISNSAYQARYIKNVYGRDSSVIFPPVEDGIATAKTVPIDIDRPFVLMVGAFVPYKNFQAGIRAAARIKESHSLAIVGSGLLKREYEHLASNLGVDLHIFYGSNDTIMHSLYAKASFLIHPSLFEGFGFIPAEAALHQKPTILTTRSGVRELLRDGESSYFCDPMDVPNMSQRARHLAGSPEVATNMGARAYESIRNLCTLEQTERLWEELENWN